MKSKSEKEKVNQSIRQKKISEIRPKTPKKGAIKAKKRLKKQLCKKNLKKNDEKG